MNTAAVPTIPQLSILLMERKQTREEALLLAEEAVQINPDNARAWLAIGYINQLELRREKSVDAYARCARARGPGMFVQECRGLLPRSRR